MTADAGAAEGVFERLKASCPEDWAAYTGHAFVRGLADGSLPETCFRWYLAQDYLFLINFARAYALAGIDDPRQEIDLVELGEEFSYQELLWLEGLGLCGPGEASSSSDSTRPTRSSPPRPSRPSRPR